MQCTIDLILEIVEFENTLQYKSNRLNENKKHFDENKKHFNEVKYHTAIENMFSPVTQKNVDKTKSYELL